MSSVNFSRAAFGATFNAVGDAMILVGVEGRSQKAVATMKSMTDAQNVCANLNAMDLHVPAAVVPSRNQFGTDCHYFNEKLSQVIRDLPNYTPTELARQLARLARSADESVLQEREFRVESVAKVCTDANCECVPYPCRNSPFAIALKGVRDGN